MHWPWLTPRINSRRGGLSALSGTDCFVVLHAGVTLLCMSSSTTTMARSAFSTAAFAQLVRRLRHTNARYNQIALQFRCRIRRTYHAKRRAYRAGLCIDTAKARACPDKYVSTHPPPVLDRSEDDAGVDAGAYATTAAPAIGHGARGVHPGDACMRPRHATIVPEHVVRTYRRRDGRQRVTLRLPPLKLHLDVDYAPFQGTVPGAPRLVPRQLPEDECGMEEMVLASGSSSSCTCALCWWLAGD